MGTTNPDAIPATNPEIVNREDELSAIQETLYRLTTPGRVLSKSVLEFNGIGGIGKTTLLNKFWRETKTKKNLHGAFIDFKRFFEGQQVNLNALIVDIVRQIGIKNEASALLEALASDTAAQKDLTSNLIEYFQAILHASPQEASLALIFDSVDEADLDTKTWLIRLVDSTVDAGKILFAVASKMSMGFVKLPNLERKVYSFRLKEFDQEFTLRQIQTFSHFEKTENLDKWAHAVYRLTQGHPLANEIVVAEAHKRQYHPHTIASNQYELIKILDEQVVNQKVFQGYDEKAIGMFRQMLTHLSIPRMFNLVSMGKLIGEFAKEYALKSSWHYSNYVSDLQNENSFIRYSREKSGYVVDPILRSVFSLTLKNENPDKFSGMHKFLADLYAAWIEDAQGTDKTKFFIEKIYHQLSLGAPANTMIPQFKDFADLLEKSIAEERRRDAKQQLIEEFKADPDLGEFFNEEEKRLIQSLFQ